MPRTTLLRKQVTPTGTIQPHAGATAPEGFLVCDGSIVNIADYPKLYAVIGTSWGHGNEVSPGVSDGLTFHLPDLRGRFLRGTDNPSGIPGEEAGRDPDADLRTGNAPGGNTGNNVGSVQDDDFGSHGHGSGNHSHSLARPIFQSYSPAYELGYDNVHGRPTDVSVINSSGTLLSDAGGSETRGKNANVIYCIKAV